MEIPHRELSEEALRGVIESFVLREGTDYGPRDYSFEEKIAAVMRQLDRGEAAIVFDPDTGTVSIVVASPPDRRARIGGLGRDEA
ncbi:MAG: YheU family protein [Thiotrichales bacterium]|nr:YheU family protein [Thiotrichales bacterium]